MGFDGRMPQRKVQTLSNREAAMLYGEGWECSESGAEVWQRVKVGVAALPAALLPTEQLAVNRASRLLTRHRLAAQMIVEQLQQRAGSLAHIPFSRLITGNTSADLREQALEQQKRLDALPRTPKVHRLDPDQSTELPNDAKKVGASIWFLDRASMMLSSREITRVTLERLNETPTLVYETTGTLTDGNVVRRSCAHHLEGLKVLNHGEIAFLDPMAARDYLNRQMSSRPAAVIATAAPVPVTAPPAPAPVPKPVAKPAAGPASANGSRPRAAEIVVSTPPQAEPIIEGEIDEAHALRPFDESMLHGRSH